jgi:hypothetical protein
VIQVTKSAITKTWISGLVVFAAGVVAAIVGVVLMLAYGGTFTQVAGNPNSYDFVPRLDGFFWSTVTVICIGGVIAVIGGIVQLAAWIGALVNSYLLPEKTWFAILLVGGILGLFFGLVGFAAMVAYVIGAPDGTPYKQPRVAAPAPLAPTT